MPLLTLLMLVITLSVLGYILARMRVLSLAGGDARKLHSLPQAYGWHAALLTFLPALGLIVVWLVVQPMVVEQQVAQLLSPEVAADATARTLALSDVRRVAEGLDTALQSGAISAADLAGITLENTDVGALLKTAGVALGAEVTQAALDAALMYRGATETGALWRGILTLALAVAGLAAAFAMTKPDLRARNRVERVILGALIVASSIAILTTLGIIWSMLRESFNFFQLYSATDFFFGTVWNPQFRGGSDLGFLPLLWGTLYITFVSMVVAVPLGIFTAIYLAEYASARTRSIVKPLIEVIAGIPTVVFGLFALVTVGPMLRDYFAQPLGLGNSGASVMTAGIVIGVLNIPFISSLADDIINAVPQSLRDGSYGLGATRSETIRQVVLPAALPGIVGAVLLAGSRAIGETMVVTMGAGAAAKLSMNPFEAMTTMTVKIVGQLTGDTEFASPETLVAFALGITLFVITLGLNILALMIVNKYREQYE